MMYTQEQVINGCVAYIDHEVIELFPTAGKWIVGSAVALLIKNSEKYIKNAQTINTCKMLGIMNDDGLYDVNKLADVLKDNAKRYGEIEINCPGVGRLSFSDKDIDLIKKYIMGGSNVSG